MRGGNSPRMRITAAPPHDPEKPALHLMRVGTGFPDHAKTKILTGVRPVIFGLERLLLGQPEPDLRHLDEDRARMLVRRRLGHFKARPGIAPVIRRCNQERSSPDDNVATRQGPEAFPGKLEEHDRSPRIFFGDEP